MAANAKDDLIAAVADLETAAENLATAHDKFVAAARAIVKATPEENRKLSLSIMIGPTRLYDLLVPRLRQLGLGPLLNRSRVPGTLGSAWTTELVKKVQTLVP
jgi:hypothetical protein